MRGEAQRRSAQHPVGTEWLVVSDTAQLPITARMYIAAPLGRLGLRGAAARRSATWPLGPFGLGATSHTCDSLCVIALMDLHRILLVIGGYLLAVLRRLERRESFRTRVTRCVRRPLSGRNLISERSSSARATLARNPSVIFRWLPDSNRAMAGCDVPTNFANCV
jgi:hypothetical protein